MTEFQFQLHFQLPESEPDAEAWLDALFEAGCDDALIGMATPGYVSLDFTRDAADAWGAMQTAITDVQQAIPEARLVSVGPDLMNLSELAELFSERLTRVTRQAMRKYAKGEVVKVATRFPSPRVSGTTPLWHVNDVALWMKENKKINPTIMQRADALIALASAARTINVTGEYKRTRVEDPDLARKAEEMVAQTA